MTKTFFIDDSHWQGVIQWATTAQHVEAAIHKATEATYYKDDQYPNNKRGCEENCVPFGAYHFLRPNYDPIEQAKVFLDYTGAGVKTYVCDCETPLLLAAAEMLESANLLQSIETAQVVVPSRGMAKWSEEQTRLIQQILYPWSTRSALADAAVDALQLYQIAEAFCDYVISKRPGAKVGIYTSPYFWKTFFRCLDGSYPNWNDKYFLWIAHYYADTPIIPYPWTQAAMHQYADNLTIPGIPSKADGNWFYGTVTECAEFFGNGGIVVDLEPEMPEKVTVTATTLYLRSEPSAKNYYGSIIGQTSKGKILYPEDVAYDEYGKKWWRLGKKIYCAAWYTM